MKIKKIVAMLKISAFILVGVIICSTQTYAIQIQKDDENSIIGSIDDGVNEDGDNLNIQIIADTNIRRASITKKNNNSFEINFSIVNEWNKTQPGVKYAIEAYTTNVNGGVLVDRVVSDDVDSLIPKQEINKKITYKLPRSLPVGEYAINIVLASEKGLTLSIAALGKVEKKEQSGIYINPEKCQLVIAGKKFALMQGVDISRDEQLKLICEEVKNLEEKTISTKAYIATTKRTSFGKLMDEKKLTKEIFSVGVNKEVVYLIKTLSIPQAYDTKLTLKSNESTISNNIFFRYVVQGESATAQNATTDKDYYEKGEVARVTIMTSGMASAYPGARDKNALKQLTDAENLVIDVKILNVDNKMCSENKSKHFSGYGENVQINIPILEDCKNPNIITKIKNKNGLVLDEANFSIETSSINSDQNVSNNLDEKSFKVGAVNILVVLCVLLIILFFIMKKFHNTALLKVLLMLFFIGGNLFTSNINNAEATAFTTGHYHCFTLLIDSVLTNGYCVVNGTYDVIGNETCEDTIATASMNWGACSNMTIDANLYINGGNSVWHRSQQDDYNGNYLNINSGIKSKNLGKLSIGNQVIPFKITFYHQWHDWVDSHFSPIETEIINTSKSINIVDCLPINAACGTRNTTYAAATTNYPSGSTWCNPGSLHSRDWGGASTYFPGKGESKTWTCIGEGEGTDIACHASRLDDDNHIDPYCTGLRPVGAIMCSGDDMGVTENTQWEEVANCTNTRKCEYTMDDNSINAACGTRNTTYAAATTNYPSGSTWCNPGSLHSRDWGGASTYFPGKGESKTWTCIGEGGGTDIACHASRLDDDNHIDPYCAGLRPVGAIMCSGDDMGVTENTQWEEVANCTNTRKCEYTMTGGTNGNPTCGPASSNTVEYENAGEVENAGLCGDGNALSEWPGNSDNFSDITDEGGTAWTWKCSKGGNTIECSALRKGECATVTGGYADREDACEKGLFNSVHLAPSGILQWKCGTSGHNDRHVGSFTSDDSNSGAVINPGDNFSSVSVGTNDIRCQCRPGYDYFCEPTGFTEGCSNNCGGTTTERYQAYKKDNVCFLGEPAISIDKSKYLEGAGSACVDKVVNCPPCGTQDSEGGIFHETNF